MKTTSMLTVALAFGAAMLALAVEPSAALFENDSVKVSRALEKANVKGSFHEHKSNRVMVYLESGRQRFEYQDARPPATFDWKAGQVVFSPSEGMHSPEVVSDDPFNIVEIELKKPGTAKAAAVPNDPLKIDSQHFKLEFENSQVRVLRVKLAAHESTPAVEYPDTVAVFLSDERTHKFGEALWQPASTRKLENSGDKPLEMVWAELKF